MKNISLLSFFLICTLGVSSLFAQNLEDEYCPDAKTYYSLFSANYEPEKVEKLDLAMTDPKLETVPEEVGRLYNLKCLVLSFNRIGALPENFANLQKLEYLDLSGNRYLSSPPEVLSKLPNLKAINFRDIPEWSEATKAKAREMYPNVILLF